MAYLVKAVLITVLSLFGYTKCTDCPDRWVAYEGSCYLFGHGVTETFVEAEHFCRQHSNGHLVEVQSNSENLFIKDFVKSFGAPCFWSGLTDEHIEGQWRWYHSGSSPVFTDWYPSQPDMYDNEDCVVIWKPFDYKWGDISCSHLCEPLCKISDTHSEIVG